MCLLVALGLQNTPGYRNKLVIVTKYMKLDRKFFFRIHSWIGIKLSILFFIVCFSGTMATLSHEMDWLFIPETRATYQETKADKNTVVDNLMGQFPTGKIIYWAAAAESYLCDIVYVNID